MDGAPIEGPKEFGKRGVARLRKGKMREETFRRARFPVEGIRFVIAHERRDGNGFERGYGGKPALPLRFILPVVDEIAHRNEKIGVRHFFESFLRRIFPDIVIGRLRIGENECRKRGAVVRPKGHPWGNGISGPRAIFVCFPGREILGGGFVNVGIRRAV